MNNKYRIFIGLNLSGYLMDVIPMIRSTIYDKKQLINWISGKNLHLTLSFIGDIDLEKIEILKEQLISISTFDSFDMLISGTGIFPSEKNPKILWLDIEKGRQELIDIQKNIEKTAISFKSDIKNEEYIPHITIGRIKNVNKNINFDLSTFLNAVYSSVRIPVKTIYLFKSELLESGVKYSIISQYSLK